MRELEILPRERLKFSILMPRNHGISDHGPLVRLLDSLAKNAAVYPPVFYYLTSILAFLNAEFLAQLESMGFLADSRTFE